MAESKRERNIGAVIAFRAVDRPAVTLTERMAVILRKHHLPLARGKWEDYELGCKIMEQYCKLNDEIKERIAQWVNLRQ